MGDVTFFHVVPMSCKGANNISCSPSIADPAKGARCSYFQDYSQIDKGGITCHKTTQKRTVMEAREWCGMWKS